MFSLQGRDGGEGGVPNALLVRLFKWGSEEAVKTCDNNCIT